MSRWGELIPHDEDNPSCLCGCMDEEITEDETEDDVTTDPGCRECPRTGLTLTQNGRVRSHTADGLPRTGTNPNCPGGSALPEGVDHETEQPMQVSR